MTLIFAGIRLVYHNDKAGLPQQARVLAKLGQINVISVESITTTLSLGPCKETTPEDVSFEETDDKFTVFVSRTGGTSGKSVNPHICKELSRLLGVDMMSLFTCISNNVEVVRDIFGIDGIEEIPEDDDDDGHDRSWLQAILHPNLPVIPTPVAAAVVVPERPPSPASPPSPLLQPPSPSALSVHDARQFPPLGTRGPRTTPRQRADTQSSGYSASPANGRGGGHGRQRNRSAQSSVGLSEHSQFLQRSRSPFNAGLQPPAAPLGLPGTAGNAARDMGRLAAQAQAFLNVNNGNQMVSGGAALGGNPVWPPFGNFNFPPTATDDTDLVGVMGEHYVRSPPKKKTDALN
jgi:hypothetical protein